jgi:hypothetical protein
MLRFMARVKPVRHPEESETQTKAKLLEVLKMRGIRAWRQSAGSLNLGGRFFLGSPKGTPDTIVHLGGASFGFLELKRGKGRPSKEQLEWCAWAQAEGVPHAFVRSLEEALLQVSVWRRDALLRRMSG